MPAWVPQRQPPPGHHRNTPQLRPTVCVRTFESQASMTCHQHALYAPAHTTNTHLSATHAPSGVAAHAPARLRRPTLPPAPAANQPPAQHANSTPSVFRSPLQAPSLPPVVTALFHLAATSVQLAPSTASLPLPSSSPSPTPTTRAHAPLPLPPPRSPPPLPPSPPLPPPPHSASGTAPHPPPAP